MQGIWSRAAQLPGCHCRACLHTVNTVTRRATTGSRRKVLASDVFTACYTAIMATAALLDAGRKDRRRRDLDRQIEEAKSKLAMLRQMEIDEAKNKLATLLVDSAAPDLAQIVTSESTLAHAFRNDRQTKFDALRSIGAYSLETLLGSEEKTQDRKRQLKDVRGFFSMRWRDDNGCTGVTSLAKCAEAIALEEVDDNISQREPANHIQFSRMGDMINDLVDGLLREVYRDPESKAPHSLDSAWTAIRMLRSDGYPRYSHPELDREGATEARRLLNEVNRRIMADWRVPRRERFVAKICYNLLVSDVPPGIHNYNALILGFTQLGEHGLAQAVVDSFLFNSHLKPTGATLICLLHHYRLKRDIVGFYSIIRRLVGQDPRGIGLGRRTISEMRLNPLFRSWAAVRDVSASKGYVFERPNLDQSLMEALLEGLLDFNMLGHAAKVFVACLQEKCAVSVELLDRLLRACIATLDDIATGVLIQGFLGNIDETTSMILGAQSLNPLTVGKLRVLLNIGHAQSSYSCGPATTSHLSIGVVSPASERVTQLVTSLWLRETLTEISLLGHSLKLVERALLGEGSLEHRLDSAISILDSAAKRPKRILERTERTHRLARLVWLQAQVDASERQIKAIEHQMCNILAKSIPRPMRTVALFNQSLSIEKRIEHYRQMHVPGTKQYRTASVFARSRELDADLKAALMEALPVDQRTAGEAPLQALLDRVSRHLSSLQSQEPIEDDSSCFITEAVSPIIRTETEGTAISFSHLRLAAQVVALK
ncbi:hypothetical protein QBC46DRAFT_369608 [Diplogelasinospora grovesii]|uniref:Pentatricopeptide repeat domain-containing protein n=1 Tax=Diplogelasinospora grovesii TaxID=303347 RepID=A0AAN6SB02_9PEZI|nr:hypothetical protein QBC46DRAFT_369608 [Diplogelasinospora grovesii]